MHKYVYDNCNIKSKYSTNIWQSNVFTKKNQYLMRYCVENEHNKLNFHTNTMNEKQIFLDKVNCLDDTEHSIRLLNIT